MCFVLQWCNRYLFLLNFTNSKNSPRHHKEVQFAFPFLSCFALFLSFLSLRMSMSVLACLWLSYCTHLNLKFCSSSKSGCHHPSAQSFGSSSEPSKQHHPSCLKNAFNLQHHSNNSQGKCIGGGCKSSTFTLSRIKVCMSINLTSIFLNIIASINNTTIHNFMWIQTCVQCSQAYGDHST